ncbi:hypothetical protein E2C01_068083 [Portunus trituberculatus]|uniref:Uncharacterized protein n=1 Tax=Portunus trituberculatus TaxID=210409 RepID=A0A5B7HVK7_PORTR|nr:hypothetical protein [Portunus trituberculatus]
MVNFVFENGLHEEDHKAILAQEEKHSVVAQEVGVLNDALALLGNANFRNNLAQWYVMKRELNQKFSHLCTEKVPMTRFLFGDDISKSVKQIEESAKLKSTITAKKTSFPWRLPGNRTRGSGPGAAYRRFSSCFQPYGFQNCGLRDGPLVSPGFRDMPPKNAKSRGGSRPWQ